VALLKSQKFGGCVWLLSFETVGVRPMISSHPPGLSARFTDQCK